MLFNSYEFIFIFLPLTLAGYFLFAKYKLIKLSTAWLVFASLAFYTYWDIRYLPLLVISILFNFTAGSFIEKNCKDKIKSKRILTFAVIVNLCLLGYYKYYGFFLDSVNQAFDASLYYETSHYRPMVGDMIIARIFGVEGIAPDDFGVFIEKTSPEFPQ